MSGAEESGVDPNTLIRFERLDFDAAYGEVQLALKPMLQQTIAEQFGISSLTIAVDPSGIFDSQKDYDNVISWSARTETEEGLVQITCMTDPGYMAIDRYYRAIEYYLEQNSESRGLVTKTSAFEMYAAGLVTHAYIYTALKELNLGSGKPPAEVAYVNELEVEEELNIPRAGDEDDPTYTTDLYTGLRGKATYVYDTLRSTDGLREVIISSEFANKDELLKYLNFLTYDGSTLIRANIFRLAAGLYFEFQKRAEGPLRGAFVETAQEALRADIESIKNNDTAILDKFQVALPTPDSVEVAKILTDDPAIIEELEAFNRAKAEELHLDLIGWAFPMSRQEIYRFFTGVKDN